jgi:DNA-binding transcriptional MerR regulator
MADKAPGALLTIGELSAELGVPQHILRYWETKFSKLRPLTRAGNRRYYRPDDVALVRRIHQLLNGEGYTVKGVQKLLSGKTVAPTDTPSPVAATASAPQVTAPAQPAAPPSYIPDLVLIRDRLKIALAAARG